MVVVSMRPESHFASQHTELQLNRANPNFNSAVFGFSMLCARDGTRRRTRTIVQGHGEMQRHAEPAVG
jgi:hypothetical protein